ncbi:MAG: hypothetical protein IJ088_06625 [Clostridia bacterium]|nr:hypothetical protein [Clostridia bacterium]
MEHVNNHMYITVPINKEGYDEYDHGIEFSDNLIVYHMPYDEYKKLVRGRVFRVLETRYIDLYIVDGESAVITAERLIKVYDAINAIPGVFLEAVDKAIELGTCVFIDF